VEALAAQVLRERRIIARSNPVVLVARDGREVPVEKNAAPVQDNAGLVIGIVLVLHDVTARIRMEQALRDEARRKDDFLALLGHELRNPLAPIGNAVFLLRRHGQDPNLANQACAIIERQAAHLAHLVDDLLDVSRLSRGKIQLKLEALDLVQVVREVLVDYQPSLTRKELALEADLPAGPVRVEADKARLTQTVGNLLHNAVKFTGEGGRIRMSVAAGQDGTGCVCVADTGPGIRPERLDSIFEPFTQDRDTIGRSQNGLGLGLALVKRLVELHGGRVAAHSEGLGHGARFEIRLPLLATAPPAAERPAARPAPRGRARRILIVEDLPDTAATLQLLLQTHGHAVATAADGDSALARAGSFEPEIVLCDIGLPGALDGHDVARALRRTPGLEKVHLIALTGFGAPEDKARAAQAGFDGHLTKPVQPEDLLALIAGIP
jgi:signal transduction histidine kinase/CheY-like chemotaxis protein